MRLLNINTFRLEEFMTSPPPYAVLSHTWGNEEISLQEFLSPDFQANGSRKSGWAKIANFCNTLRKSQPTPPVEYAWIDTCCVDKTSSAELSEAINSMFRWYKASAFCCAFLSDVQGEADHLGPDFNTARWFTRGFTLQELLAPTDVQFFDAVWQFIGSKKTLAKRIASITRIPEELLSDGRFQAASIAQKLSWASGRQTTRTEDIAYCLLGILDINMPLLYGEGSKAFIRLQEEILKQNDDQSIFAWDASGIDPRAQKIGVLAPSPKYFSGSSGIQCLPAPLGGEPSISSRGISIDLPLHKAQPLPSMNSASRTKRSHTVVLSCPMNGDIGSRVGIHLILDPSRAEFYTREASPPEIMQIKSPEMQTRRIVLQKQIMADLSPPSLLRCLFRYKHDPPLLWVWKECYPGKFWTHNQAEQSLTLDLPVDKISKPLPECLNAAVVFHYVAHPSKKQLYFAVEMRFRPVSGRLYSSRLVDLTQAFADTQNQSLKEVIDEKNYSTEPSKNGGVVNGALSSFIWKHPSIIPSSISLDTGSVSKLVLSATSAPVQAIISFKYIHGAPTYTVVLSRGHRSFLRIYK
ncbi:hypothetical protein QQS21_003569 [Conoideocrella luteorostrata]|uniref:Heterokaryon incompatibility domain-containing protein n=1 Tax=Conoideocrella luteorostrata TaxID=1105319 RepID=A0AAJ0G269_9HYPO|nr:hypothetical protein QQS21_003569 [Conoideocrella luteorostrata]